MTPDPDYLSTLTDVFANLTGVHAQKKRDTILAIVDARLSGQPIERVFERPETCTRTIWHTKWKHDPAIGGLVTVIYEAASRWRDEKGLRAMLLAQERLALASPLAVTRILQRLESEDEAIILRAAFGILDRAGLETASKATAAVDVTSKGEKLKGYAIFSPDDWDDEKETGDDGEEPADETGD